MKNKPIIRQILSILIMPVSLLFALAIIYIVYKSANVDFSDLCYDYAQFYVFSAPVVLFFAGGIAIPKIWDKDNEKLSEKLLAISFVLNIIIVYTISAFEDLNDDLYIFNPFGYMGIDAFTSIFKSEYIVFLPFVWAVNIIVTLLLLVGIPLLGAYLFSLKKKKIKIPVLCIITLTLISVGVFGIASYISDNIFYDVKGNQYDNPYDVVYYDESGNSYKIEENPDYDFNSDMCNVKVRSTDGSKEYYLGECYINEKTGLMIADPLGETIVPLTTEENEEMNAKESDNSYIQIYKDKSENEYRQIANALYDKSGKLLKKFRNRSNSTYYRLLKDANADANYYHYDLYGNRYILGEKIKYYDAQGNTYIQPYSESYGYSTNLDIYDKNGKKIGVVDEYDCLIDIKTGLLIKSDLEYNVDSEYFEDKNGNKYLSLDDTVYDKNGKVSKSDTLF